MFDKNKKEIAELIKTHISYLSIIILVVGLNLRYSLPSIFPISNNFDVKYFGSILVQFGILLFIGNLLIDKYKEEVTKRLFTEILDQRVGYRGSSLLTEVVNLVNPFAYNLSSYEAIGNITKLKPQSKFYDIIQIFRVEINPKQDNVHYCFGMGTTTGGKKPKIEYVKLNGKKLTSNELRLIPSSSLSGVYGLKYQIITPLKLGKRYDIEIKTIYPSCMSDLNDNKEYDENEYEFRALTEKAIIKNKYNFKNFEDYEFRAEKRYLNIPNIVELECKIDKKNKEITVESGNLKNGDRICIVYTKKA